MICKLKELQDVICDLQSKKDSAIQEVLAARQVVSPDHLLLCTSYALFTTHARNVVDGLHNLSVIA